MVGGNHLAEGKSLIARLLQHHGNRRNENPSDRLGSGGYVNGKHRTTRFKACSGAVRIRNEEPAWKSVAAV